MFFGKTGAGERVARSSRKLPYGGIDREFGPSHPYPARSIPTSIIPHKVSLVKRFLVKNFSKTLKILLKFLLELSCFFHDPADVGNLISGSSDFSKTSLNIRKFTVHILLKPGLENFEHYFTSVYQEAVSEVLVNASVQFSSVQSLSRV